MTVLAAIRALFRRPDGRLRSFREVRRVLDALRSARGGTKADLRRARWTLQAAGGHPMERTLLLRLARELRAEGREDEVPKAVADLTDDRLDEGAGWLWIAMRYLEAGRGGDVERALDRSHRLADDPHRPPGALPAGALGDALPGIRAAVRRFGGATGGPEVRRFDTLDPTLAALLAMDRAATAPPEVAVRLLSDVLGAPPDAPLAATIEVHVQARLGDALMRAGRPEEAVPHLARAWDLARSRPVSLVVAFAAGATWMRALLAAGRAAEAASAGRAVLEHIDADPIDPEDDGDLYVPPCPDRRPPLPDEVVELWYLLGRALAAIGDRDGARHALQTGLGLCHGDLLRRGAAGVEAAVEDAIASELRALMATGNLGG